MGYQLGGQIRFKNFTGKVAVRAPKTAYCGWEAFARDEKTGTYREVLGVSQEQEWVDGTNEGFWFHHTHDTRAEAEKFGWKAYRWLNK